MTHDPLTIAFFVLLAVLALGTLWLGSVYNRLVRLRNRADALWADIDGQLKRRHDLIPNLVAVVSGYATHERGTLDEVTMARNQAIGASNPAEQTQAENVLTGALRRLFESVESYPDLKARSQLPAPRRGTRSARARDLDVTVDIHIPPDPALRG